MKERRLAPRVKVNLRARWQRKRKARPATVTSLSSSGCFMLSGGRVRPKEFVQVYIELPSGEEVKIQAAEVVEYASQIGFAVRFHYVEVSLQLLLEEFIAECLEAAGPE